MSGSISYIDASRSCDFCYVEPFFGTVFWQLASIITDFHEKKCQRPDLNRQAPQALFQRCLVGSKTRQSCRGASETKSSYLPKQGVKVYTQETIQHS